MSGMKSNPLLSISEIIVTKKGIGPGLNATRSPIPYALLEKYLIFLLTAIALTNASIIVFPTASGCDLYIT